MPVALRNPGVELNMAFAFVRNSTMVAENSCMGQKGTRVPWSQGTRGPSGLFRVLNKRNQRPGA